MEAYKQEFIHFMVDSDVLKFGDFTLKSGRDTGMILTFFSDRLTKGSRSGW